MADTDSATHVAEHDSLVDPKPWCKFCAAEVYRRTHRCHGDGASTMSIPPARPEPGSGEGP